MEGSTRLLNQLGERYGEVLAAHNEVLRKAFAESNGQEIDTQGDSFFVAFSRGRDAIAAAVAGQRALLGHEWPDGVAVAVRMGIHTGEPALGGDRYVGLGVHRAARIAAAAHGGQVLLSNATRDLVEDDLPSDVSLHDLGLYCLKDIERPERLCELVGPGLRSRFPPLRARRPPSRIGSLVRQPITLIGLTLLVGAAVGVGIVARGRSTAKTNDLERVAADSVGKVNANGGRILGQVPVGSSPAELVAGLGSVWATDSGSDSVSKIDPTSDTVTQTIPVGHGPDGIAVAGGAVWVVNTLDGTVSRIDPRTDRQADTIRVGNQPSKIVAGDGAIWVAVSGDDAVVRIDPLTDRRGHEIAAGSGADAVAFGARAIWVASRQAGTITRLDPRDGSLVPVNVGNGPDAVTFADGAVWAANSLDGTVSRIDPKTNAVRKLITVGAGPSSLSAGSGAIWVTNTLGGTLTRIDPKTNTAHTYGLGSRPSGLTVDKGSVFVGVKGAGSAHRGGTLRLEGAVPTTVDPGIAYDDFSWSLLSPVEDGLVAFDRAGGIDRATLVPDLATALPPSNGTTYTFTLRRGLRYSNGRPVHAGDIRFALERLFKIRSPAVGVAYYLSIVGSSACIRTPKTCDLSRGIKTDESRRTVTFHLTHTDPGFLDSLALPFASAVPPATPIHDVKTNPIPGTGPYKIVQVDASRGMILERNPFFREWSEAAQPAAYPDRVELRNLPASWTNGSLAALTRSLEQNRIDWLPSEAVPTSLLSELRTRFPSRVHEYTFPNTVYLALNNRRPPFDDVRVRRALNYAIDRKALIQAFPTLHRRQPTCQLLPPNFPGYHAYCPYTLKPTQSGRWTAPDLDEAKRLVTASGAAGDTVQIATPTWGRSAAHYISSVLQGLGFRPRLQPIADNKYLGAVDDSRNNIELSFGGWTADYPSPVTFFRPLLGCDTFIPASQSNTNDSEFCDPAIDRQVAIAQQLAVTDPHAALALWERIDRQVTEKAPSVYYANQGVAFDLLSQRVGNYQRDPEFGVRFSQLWLH